MQIPATIIQTSNVGLLGSTAKTSGFTTASATAVQITGLTVTVTIPDGRSTKITVAIDEFYNTVALAYATLTLWDGTVGSGTQIGQTAVQSVVASAVVPGIICVVVAPAAGSKTYNVGLSTGGTGTAGIVASATDPASIIVECV